MDGVNVDNKTIQKYARLHTNYVAFLMQQYYKNNIFDNSTFYTCNFHSRRKKSQRINLVQPCFIKKNG